MADGPEPGITDESGAALAFEDGAGPGGAAVESCKEPCGGCGQEPSCCICVDVDAGPGLPCVPNYSTPRDRWCNPKKSCCCGTRVRVVWERNASYFRRTDTPGVGFKQFDGYWKERAVFEIAVRYGPDGKCNGFERTDLEYDWKNYNHTKTESKESETLQEGHDPQSIGSFLRGAMGEAKVLCRPEPAELAVALLGGGNSPYSPNTGDGDWSKLFQAEGCNGERKEEDTTPPATRLFITRWRSSASCRSLRIEAEVDNEFADAFSSGTEDVSQVVTMELEVLEDECCPPEGPHDPHTGPFTPEPGVPGLPGENPGAVGDRCLRCGERMRGEKCLWCGWCVSCGG